MIKILYILSPFKCGGGEIFLDSLLNEFKKSKKIKTDVVCYTDSVMFTNLLIKAGYNPILVNKKLRIQANGKIKIFLLSLLFFFQSIFNLKLINSYDILHVHSVPLAFAVGILTKLRLIRKKVIKVYTYHATKKDGSGSLYLKIYSYLLGSFDKIIGVSTSSSDSLKTNFPILFKKIETVSNGVDLQKLVNLEDRASVRRKYKIKKDDVIGIYVARYISTKNHKFLIDVVKKTKNKNFKIIIVGEGELKKNFVNEIRANELSERFILFDFIENKELYNLLGASDFCIFPSISEGLSVVLLENSAMKLPIVCFENVCPVEVRVALRSSNEEEFIKNVEYVLDSNNRKKIVSEMSEYVEDYGISKTAKHYIQIYDKLFVDN